MKLLGVISFLIFIFFGSDEGLAQKLSFAADLKYDLERLGQHGVMIRRDIGTKDTGYTLRYVKKDFAYFVSLLKLNLHNYKYSKSNSGKIAISLWQNRMSRVKRIYQVEMTTAVDTSLAIVNLKDETKQESYKIKGIFIYRAYLMILHSGEKLSYITEQGEGLCNYAIGNKKIIPVYEDIVMQPGALYEQIIAKLDGLIALDNKKAEN